MDTPSPSPWWARLPFGALLREASQDLRVNEGREPILRRDWVVFLVLCALLIVFQYYGRPTSYRIELGRFMDPWLGIGPKDLYGPLMPFAWWALAGLVLRVALPAALVRWGLRESPRDYGYRLIGEGNYGRYYVGLYFLMLPLVVGMSFTSGFQAKYPMCDEAAQSLTYLALFEVCYAIQFLAVESFFRGFGLFALHKRFGYHALWMMAIPYCMVHFGKPVAETTGAIAAGVVLGYLSLKGRSWLHGAALHWSVGVTMDVLSILHKGGFKS